MLRPDRVRSDRSAPPRRRGMESMKLSTIRAGIRCRALRLPWIGIGVLALAACAAVAPLREAAVAEPPSLLFGELFAVVQTSGLFEDSKQFADAVPRGEPQEILSSWRSQRDDPDFSLERFVETHFEIEPAIEPPPPQEGLDLCRHIDELWSVLTRPIRAQAPGSSLLSLPYPAIVPGGRFREVYYWDSYFSLLGPSVTGRDDLVRNMVDNFAYLLDTYGHIPNGTRTYYLSRSQPPFFYEMVALISPEDPAAAFARYLPQLRREHAFWMDGEHLAQPGRPYRRVVALEAGVRVNRYWDDRAAPRDESYREDVQLARESARPAEEVYRHIRAAAESGWDFSSRWFADGRRLATIETTDIVPIDLNSLLFGLERAIVLGCTRIEDAACVEEFERRATSRRAAIQQYLWQEEEGVYADYHWRHARPTGRYSAATLYPLFTGVAQAGQARDVARFVREKLLQPGGLVTTTSGTGEQWDWPNGWAPLQWIAIRGLLAYGEAELARTIAERWLANVDRVYHASGKLVEKYDVVDLDRPGGGGEYPLQDGFGWTNGVTARLARMYPDERRDCAPPSAIDAGRPDRTSQARPPSRSGRHAFLRESGVLQQ